MRATGWVLACKRSEGLSEGWPRSEHDQAETDPMNLQLRTGSSWIVCFRVLGCSLGHNSVLGSGTDSSEALSDMTLPHNTRNCMLIGPRPGENCRIQKRMPACHGEAMLQLRTSLGSDSLLIGCLVTNAKPELLSIWEFTSHFALAQDPYWNIRRTILNLHVDSQHASL